MLIILNNLLDNTEIPTDLQKGAIQLQRTLEWDDDASELVTSHEDDEYKWAGVEDPKIVITTSRDPSSRLKMFAKVSEENLFGDLKKLILLLFTGTQIALS